MNGHQHGATIYYQDGIHNDDDNDRQLVCSLPD
jgi:hypothetical protein